MKHYMRAEANQGTIAIPQVKILSCLSAAHQMKIRENLRKSEQSSAAERRFANADAYREVLLVLLVGVSEMVVDVHLHVIPEIHDKNTTWRYIFENGRNA